jgi:hypothetical protein
MTRREGWAGVAFVVGVLVSAAVISLPPSSWPPARIADFYHAHAAVVVATQLVGVLAAAAFLLLLRGLRRGARSSTRWLTATGVGVVICELLTAAPILVLALLDTAEPQTWTQLTRLSELADDVLFCAIALFAAALAVTAAARWLRVFAWLVAAVTLARGALGFLDIPALDQIAPVLFLALVLAASVRMLIARPETDQIGHPSVP